MPEKRRVTRRVRSLPETGSDAGEWLSMAFPNNQGFKDESDAALKEALNEICNRTLNSILRDDPEDLIDVNDELYSLGQFFSKQGNIKAAKMMFVLYKICNHSFPKEAESLDGPYEKAFLKIWSIIEDSGWKVRKEDDDEESERE